MSDENRLTMPYPTPLFFRVPEGVLHDALTAPFCELDPTFLCFESFYQAVALTWPYRYNVIDIGGYMGVQGWLFGDFESYTDVNPALDTRRCALPPNGRHVERDGIDYLEQLRLFGTVRDDDLFVCSAVPDGRVRQAVTEMPNHVVWYPGEEMDASGPFGESTKEAFARLNTESCHKKRENAVMAAIESDFRSA